MKWWLILFQFQNFIADYGNLPQTNIVDTEEKQSLLDQVIYEHLLRHGRIDVADELVKVS